MKRDYEKLELPPELEHLDVSLREQAALSLQADSNGLSAGFADRIIKAAKAQGAPAQPAPARIVPIFQPWLAAAVAAVVLVAAVVGFYASTIESTVGQITYSEAGQSRHAVQRGALLAASAPMTAQLDSNRIHLMLNSSSELRVESASEVALLSGDAWFHVRPNSGPFSVKTQTGTVSVVGTSFGVSIRNGRALVQVTRGKVKTEFGGQTGYVAAGSSLEVGPGGLLAQGTLNEYPEWAKAVLEKEGQERIQLFFPSAAPVDESTTK